jgi:hypothetical protein
MSRTGVQNKMSDMNAHEMFFAQSNILHCQKVRLQDCVPSAIRMNRAPRAWLRQIVDDKPYATAPTLCCLVV